MKIRDSGMPDEGYWESLFDVSGIVARLGIGAHLGDVAELGCGYGTFSIPVARAIAGTLHTFDLEPAMVERTTVRAREAGLANVVCRYRDVIAEGFGLSAASTDAVLLFNILPLDEPVALLNEAGKVLRPGGRLLVIHWRHDPATPRGPDLAIRPRPEQIIEWVAGTGHFEAGEGPIDLPPWHFGLRFARRAANVAIRSADD